MDENTNNQLQKRILIVEDDNNLSDIYSTMLQAEGFVVKRVGNGEEALSTALDFHPSIVLLDAMIPVLSGFDVLDIFRNTPETADLKIVMLTALSQEGDIQRAKNLKVDEYLIKSQVDTAEVIDHIKKLVG